MVNAGERLIVNNCSFGYLSHRIVFYLTNLHIKTRHTYFARVSKIFNRVFFESWQSPLESQKLAQN